MGNIGKPVKLSISLHFGVNVVMCLSRHPIHKFAMGSIGDNIRC